MYAGVDKAQTVVMPRLGWNVASSYHHSQSHTQICLTACIAFCWAGFCQIG
jgi:hypothetical protein